MLFPHIRSLVTLSFVQEPPKFLALWFLEVKSSLVLLPFFSHSPSTSSLAYPVLSPLGDFSLHVFRAYVGWLDALLSAPWFLYLDPQSIGVKGSFRHDPQFIFSVAILLSYSLTHEASFLSAWTVSLDLSVFSPPPTWVSSRVVPAFPSTPFSFPIPLFSLLFFCLLALS